MAVNGKERQGKADKGRILGHKILRFLRISRWILSSDETVSGSGAEVIHLRWFR